MTEKRWLTKDEKRLLKPHAEHYGAMGTHIRDASIGALENLNNACQACTEFNCGWSEYHAAQYLKREINREIGWRNRRDAEAAESALPTAHVLGRLADDGGPISEHQ